MVANPVRVLVALLLSSLLAAFALLWSGDARATAKDECIDAHGRGQDLREKGQLVRARQLFLTCAQPTCPGLVQSDCARFSEEIGRLVPTVSFAARDAAQADIPITSVYVDEVLFASRLDDGKSYEVDPGKHVIRYVHDGRETTVRVVVNQGEKGRALVATFPGDGATPGGGEPSTAPLEPKRPILPLLVASVGGAALVTGGVLLWTGLHHVPSNCSLSTHDCAGAVDDPSLNDASHGVSLANTGLAVGVAGAAVMTGGLIWYFVQPLSGGSTDSARTHAVTPWVGKNAGGVGWSGSF
jgi:hypothetical protein